MQNKSSGKANPHAKNPDYFEGCLQLRNINEELILYVQSQLRKNPTVFISKEVTQPNGLDLYVSSNKWLLKLGKGLNETFMGELKISSRLFTQNRLTSKEVYRMTVFFKRASFRRGDEVIIREKKYKILSHGQKVRVQEISSGKKLELTFDVVQSAVENAV